MPVPETPLSEAANTDNDRRWADGAVVYHIYPRSFQDSNGDGIGDLPGIIKRLGYIRDIGADAIWLSPFYPSPQADFGYDVADYCAVDPQFGTIEDFKQLLTQAHEYGLKVMVDLVPNHTSDEHAWFKESRQSRTNPRHNWYVWQDAVTTDISGQPVPPNNWRDALSGDSAWEWVPERKQFYLHSFHVKQPDLNWANNEVREAVKDSMRFWLDLGVDGFRVDAVYWMGKHPLLIDDSRNPEYVEGEDLHYEALLHDNSRGWPAVYAYLSEMAEVLREPKYQAAPRFMVTEAYPDRHNPLAAYLSFYAAVDSRVAAPFNFEGLTMTWQAPEWRRFLRSFHEALTQFNSQCIASYAFGNHDQPRLASRLGDAAARSAAVMLMTLPGMVFTYYGDELGMHDGDIPSDQIQDPAAKGDPKSNRGRDPERTPMQWTAGHQAGFSTAARTWLPVSNDYRQLNVETELQDEQSSLRLYQKLGQLRRQSDSLRYGNITVIDTCHDHVLGYTRRYDTQVGYLILVNFSNQTITCEPGVSAGKRLISSDPQSVPTAAAPVSAAIELRPHEAVVYELP